MLSSHKVTCWVSVPQALGWGEMSVWLTDIQGLLPSLGLALTEMALTETSQFNGSMKFPPSYSVEAAVKEERVLLPHQPLVWWPHTRVTPIPRSERSQQGPLRRAELMAWTSFFS